MENKAYKVEDDGGATYWVIAMSPSEAISFVEEELERGGMQDEYKPVFAMEIDPAQTPVFDEGGHEPIGTMADHLDIKGVLGCSEW
jgi:hypothetical protein